MASRFRSSKSREGIVVTLKAAVTLDGRIASRTGDSKWITGEAARKVAHRLRAQHDAIMVGIGTVLADDPELTVRHVRVVKGQNPVRVVVDSDLRTPVRSKLVQTANLTPTWIFHAADAPAGRVAKYRKHPGVLLLPVRRDRRGRLPLRVVLRQLSEAGMESVLVEGGARLHGALLDAGLADRVEVFVAPVILGDARAIPLADGRGATRIAAAYRVREPKVTRLGEDVLLSGGLVKGGK